MERNLTEPTDSKTTSRSFKTTQKTKQASKKIQTDIVLESDSNKIALQEALQDPITVYEGN